MKKTKIFLRTLLVMIFLFALSTFISGLSPCGGSVARAEGEYRLPWPICTTIIITQGNKSQGPSHLPGTYMEYAIDFALNEGDPVVAVREGIVSHFEGKMTGCGGKELASKGNYIVIDHEDGTSALYLHLKSILVTEKMEHVSRGQIIGLAGKTGWTYCNAHLHFQLQRTGGWWEQSLPISFFEASSDKLNSGMKVHSQNSLVTFLLPSEKWIAFLNQNNIWLTRSDGSGLTPVTQNSDDNPRVISYKWSPDGKTLAYSLGSPGGNAIILYDVQSSTNIPLITGVGGGFDWSLNSKQIIYDTPGTGDIPSQMRNKGFSVINLENQKDRQVVKPPADNPLISGPKWSSEGSYVLFTVPCFEIGCMQQGIANYNTGQTRIFLIGGGACEWSPNDLRIACIRQISDNSSGKTTQEVVIFDENGNVLESISYPDELAPQVLKWSPDGMRLALGYYSGGKGQTDLLALETVDRSFLSPGIPADWSPDGQWILTWESGINVPQNINIVNVATGESFKITEGTIAIWQP